MLSTLSFAILLILALSPESSESSPDEESVSSLRRFFLREGDLDWWWDFFLRSGDLDLLLTGDLDLELASVSESDSSLEACLKTIITKVKTVTKHLLTGWHFFLKSNRNVRRGVTAWIGWQRSHHYHPVHTWQKCCFYKGVSIITWARKYK